ncbi:MAG: hypothetical protein MJZ12_09075 [Prevotella sp.]|nr:hypothetical protein [Prevotella sp.]
MEKNITMQMNENMEIRFNEIVPNVCNQVSAIFGEKRNALIEKIEHKVEPIAKFYSEIMEEEISPKKTLHILNAQAAFLSILLTAGAPLVCAPCVAWLGLALRGCKN